MEIFIGFDSAWAGNPKAPGAVCAVVFEDEKLICFHAPKLASFDEALSFIERFRPSSKFMLIAIDQPTIVPNENSMRPVERVVASLISWLGGGVQPANRKRAEMFGCTAPIWSFLNALGAVEDPELARQAEQGCYLIEVFPALALATIAPGCCERLKGLRYNPARKQTFKQSDWMAVANAAAHEAQRLGCLELAAWCRNWASKEPPKKAEQDALDAALCVLVALRWRLRPREESVMIGDRENGYMISPVSAEVRARLTTAAQKNSVPIDALIDTPAHNGPKTHGGRFAADAHDFEMLGEWRGSKTEMEFSFSQDAPDEEAHLNETIAESLPRIAISYLRKYGNAPAHLTAVKRLLIEQTSSAGILIGQIKPAGDAGLEFSYTARDGREKVSIVLLPASRPA